MPVCTVQYIQSRRIYLHNRLFSYFTLNSIFFHLSILMLALSPLGIAFFFSFQQEFIHRHWGRCSEGIERDNAKPHSAGCSGLGWGFHTEWGTYRDSMGKAVWVHVNTAPWSSGVGRIFIRRLSPSTQLSLWAWPHWCQCKQQKRPS